MKVSGVKGEQRGGLAIRRDYQMLSQKCVMGAYVQQTREDTRPWGLNGGQPGRPSGIVLHPDSKDERKLKSKVYGLALKAGDVIRFEAAGGGGWGDPAARDPKADAADKEEGFA